MARRRSLAAVQNCPIHQKIFDECVERFDGDARSFSFDGVLSALGFELIAESVEWDRLREWMESLGYTLTPVADAFFTMPSRDRLHMSEAAKVKFVTIGRGKKTAGYAKPTVEGGALALLWGNQKIRIRNGTQTAAAKYNSDAADELVADAPKLSTTRRMKGLQAEGKRHAQHLLAPIDDTTPGDAA